LEFTCGAHFFDPSRQRWFLVFFANFVNAKNKHDKENQLTEKFLKIDKILLLKENFELHPENKFLWYNYQPPN
jgi:hypothetical protein